MHLTAKFHRPTFNLNRSEVIVRTNKQTDTAENIHLASLRWWVLGNDQTALVLTITANNQEKHARDVENLRQTNRP